MPPRTGGRNAAVSTSRLSAAAVLSAAIMVIAIQHIILDKQLAMRLIKPGTPQRSASRSISSFPVRLMLSIDQRSCSRCSSVSCWRCCCSCPHEPFQHPQALPMRRRAFAAPAIRPSWSCSCQGASVLSSSYRARCFRQRRAARPDRDSETASEQSPCCWNCGASPKSIRRAPILVNRHALAARGIKLALVLSGRTETAAPSPIFFIATVFP